MERRVALPPEYVRKLIDKGLTIYVESSPKRIFSDDEFRKAGAIVTKSLKECTVIIGIKEIPVARFEEGKTYVFFSHVIKGQEYNMPMLKEMMDKKCTLIDYEKFIDEEGRRLIFFGRFAGLAGMINSLWSLGQRLKQFGKETPFLRIKQAHKYNSLAEAEEDIKAVGKEIEENGLPDELCPLTIGFTGYGNVSRGAQYIAGLLPSVEISPDELPEIKEKGQYSKNLIYKIVFKEEDISEPVVPEYKFELQDYYDHPEKYKNKFEKYPPHLTILMNCMYWDKRYPRILSKDYIEKLYSAGNPKLLVIGDVTCDQDGSIEFTHKGTKIDDPVFVYNPFTRKPVMGFEGEGILVMAVNILPSELPRESSLAFGEALIDFIPAIAKTNNGVPFDKIELPQPIKSAMILLKGELTPDYKYIEKYVMS